MTIRQDRNSGDGADVAAHGAGASNLTLRIASAAVLAPGVLASACIGDGLFLALCALAACGIFWEWANLVCPARGWLIRTVGLAAILGAAVSTGLNQPGLALGIVGLGAIVVGGLAAIGPGGRSVHVTACWAAAGVIYAGTALLGPALLRRDPEFGLTAILFVAVTVWVTDIFAYFVGKAVGGPLLWRRVSPNKTWAGAIGGLAAGVAGGLAVAYASGIGKLAVIGLIALLLSAVAEAGDLLESAIKRRFGVKDSGRLIPGHGGLMDRLDGLVAAALAAFMIGVLRYGMDAPGRGLLVW